MEKHIIIYHSADPDGVFSGAVALAALPGSETYGYDYNQPTEELIGTCSQAHVVMLDVTFPTEAMSRLARTCSSLLLIDHHASVKADIEWIMEANSHQNFQYVYGEGWGAAKLAWDHFHPVSTLPPVIGYVAAYDTFRNYGKPVFEDDDLPLRYALDRFRTPQEVLKEFELSHADHEKLEKYRKEGLVIMEYMRNHDSKLVNSSDGVHDCYFFVNDSYPVYRVLAFNGAIGSDFFNRRKGGVKDYDFVVGYFHTTLGWRVSLRPGSGDVDLGELARSMGGGGHRNAAGCIFRNWGTLFVHLQFQD